VTEASNQQNGKKKSDVRNGIALAITAFVISIFLYLQPDYFGILSTAAAIILIAFGFMGLGFELNKITSQDLASLINREKWPGIFDNLGIGLGFLVIWAAVYIYFPYIWLNIITSVILAFGVYGTTLGLVNVLFVALNGSNKAIKVSENEADNAWSLATKIAVIISGVIGFIASLIQILQFIKVLP
jgi:hypothetical protein